MWLFVAAALAAPRCPSTVELGPTEVYTCAGRADVVRGKEAVRVENRGGELQIVALAEGTATVVLSDGRQLVVWVSPCFATLASYRDRARELAIPGLEAECRDGLVYARPTVPLGSKWTAILRQWEDTGDFVFASGPAPTDLALRVEVAYVRRATVDRWGLGVSDPMRLFETIADHIRSGVTGTSGGLTGTIGRQTYRQEWYDLREVPLSVGTDLEVRFGEDTQRYSPRAGYATGPASGLALTFTDVVALSGGHQVRGRMSVTWSVPEETSGRATTYRAASQTSDVRLPYDEAVTVATWAPNHPLSVHNVVAGLDRANPIGALLGSGEERRDEAFLWVVAHLVRREDMTRPSDDVLERGRAALREER